jgi:hypothetical protein
MKRSVASDGRGLPLHLDTARADDHDSPLLEPTLAGLVDVIGALPQHHGLHGADVFEQPKSVASLHKAMMRALANRGGAGQ